MIIRYRDKEYTLKGFGIALKTLRRQHKLTQQEVADQLCVSRQTYSSWECEYSEIPLSNFLRLAEVYNITAEELIEAVLEI